jgi:hypothetical protein
MKKNLSTLVRLLCMLAVAGVVTACATLGGGRVITFSQADMARLLEQHGPFERRLLEVLDVRVQRPTVRLNNLTDRLNSTFDVTATERLSRNTLRGRMDVDYGLRYDAEEKAIRMTDVRVNSLDLDDVPVAKRSGSRNLAGLIAEHLLEGTVLYRFKPSDLRTAEGRGLKPADVKVTSRGVEISLAPLGQ